jgi:hypothetical protein
MDFLGGSSKKFWSDNMRNVKEVKTKNNGLWCGRHPFRIVRAYTLSKILMAVAGLFELSIIFLSSADCSGQTCLARRKQRKMLLDFKCVEFCSEERTESVKILKRKKEGRKLYDM